MLNLGNMLIKTKLKLIVLIASFGIVVLGSIRIYSTVVTLQTESLTIQKAEDAKTLSTIIHELQKERGLSAGFISSGGKLNGDKLKEERASVDTKLKSYLETHTDSKEIEKIQSRLKDGRLTVDSFLISSSEAIYFYTTNITDLIESLNANILTIQSNEELRNSITYMYIESAKEALGQIRGVLSVAFTENQFPEGGFAKLVESKSSFEGSINRFTKLAEPRYASILKNKLYTPEYNKMLSFIKIAVERQRDGKFGVDGSQWYNTASTNIDALRAVQDETMTQLIADASQSRAAAMAQLVISLILTTIILAILIIISLTISKSIDGSFSQLIKGFKDLISGGRSDTKLVVSSKDEAAQIAALFNEYITKTSSALASDAKAIAQLSEIASLASSGIFSLRVTEQGSTTQTKQAIQAVNNMLGCIEDATSKVTQAMIQFASANYQYKVESGVYAGSIGSLVAGVTALGNSNSELFAIITISGEKLEAQAKDLTSESEHLSTAANQQAASLEETAAALEEMTGNIQVTTDKAVAMAKSAGEAKKATMNGAKMADMTASSMVEIAEATKSINEAVAIIENIAFQTNILSLNAAVEAATAGEAGKGFAVVAQEVRNLANRSAEAAKEIKALTERAKTKSEDGLKISDDMNNDFKLIAEKIDQTTKMVEEVAAASRDQMMGIAQINNAVTHLDHVTQQNATVANGVSHMSQGVLNLSRVLLDTAGKTKFDSEKRKMVCDIDMIFDTTKLKLDHVSFKESSYSKIKSSKTSFSVPNHQTCDLNKWLDLHKSQISSTPIWGEIQKAHENVHSKVKEFCDHSVISNPDAATIIRLGKEIESDTMKVFEGLDRFKMSLCEAE